MFAEINIILFILCPNYFHEEKMGQPFGTSFELMRQKGILETDIKLFVINYHIYTFVKLCFLRQYFAIKISVYPITRGVTIHRYIVIVTALIVLL